MGQETRQTLYNEIREKIALAVENQLLIFLTDEQLDGCVRSVYDNVRGMKEAIPGCDLFFHVEIMDDNKMFVAAHHTKAGISVLTEGKKVTQDVMSVYDYIINQKMKEDPNKDIKTRTYLQDGKIVVEFL